MASLRTLFRPALFKPSAADPAVTAAPRRKWGWRTLLLVVSVAAVADVAVLAVLRSREAPVTSAVLPPVKDLHELRSLVAKNPKDPELRLLLGESYLHLRHYLSAREELDQGLVHGGDEWRARTGRIQANIALMRYDLAVPDLERLVALRPTRLASHLALAEARHMAGDKRAARAALDAVPRGADGLPTVEGEPDALAAGEKLATAYSYLGEWSRALDVLERCEKKDPSRLGARVMRGKALYELGRRAEAVPYLEAGVKAAPKTPELQYLLGVAYTARSQPNDGDRAFACFQQAVALQDSHGPACYALAKALDQRGKLKEATAAYYRAYHLGTEGDLPLLRSAELLLKIGNREEAWYRRGLHYEKSGKWKLAVKEYERLTSLHNACRSGFIHLARVYAQSRDPERAIDYLKRAQKLDPARAAELDWSLIQAYQQSSRLEEATALLKKQIAAGKDVDAIYYQLALIADAGGRLDEAEELVKKAIAAKPEDGSYRVGLGRLLLQRREAPGKLKVAQQVLEEAVRLAPEDPGVYYSLGMIYSHSNRPDDAILALRHAIDLEPQAGESYQTLAQVLLKAGRRHEASEMLTTFRRFQDFEQARQILTARVKREPKNPDVQRSLADFHMTAQEYYEAIARYEECLRLRPQDEQARRRLARVYGMVGRREAQQQQLAVLASAAGSR